MAQLEVRQCDVFKTFKNVRSVGIVICDGEALEAGDEVQNVEKEFVVDLSPRAYERLIKFINKGISPTAKSKGAENGQE